MRARVTWLIDEPLTLPRFPGIMRAEDGSTWSVIFEPAYQGVDVSFLVPDKAPTLEPGMEFHVRQGRYVVCLVQILEPGTP